MTARRIETVERYMTLGALSDPALENIAALAADICAVPIASIQLVDAKVCWTIAGFGVRPMKTPRQDAPCDIPVKENKTVVVENLEEDERFLANPFVTGPQRLRFYAGIPLNSSSGDAIGTLCVFDTEPRTLSDQQLRTLERLSKVVIQLLDSKQHAKAQLETEQVLEKEREFLQAVLENLSDGVVACNDEGKLTLFNRALKEFHGIDLDLSLPPSEWSKYYTLYHADGKTLMEMKDVPLMRAFLGEHIRDVEMVIAPINAKTRRFLASGQSLVGRDGRQLGAVCTMHDVTELYQKEQDLIETNRALRAATDAKSQFLANMSHEIRTPLNGILGMTSLVLDSALQPQQRENLEAVKSSAENLMTIVSDILDFSKVEAGMLHIEAVSFDFEELINSTCRSVGFAAAQKGLTLRRSHSGYGDSILSGDPGRLRQILMNLLTNAVKFTNAGEISVEARVKRRADGKMSVSVSVIDSGIGIPEDAKARLFTPFTQADSSTTRKYGGTGLGLSISKRLIELMGGEIGVQSEVGRGSEFWFSLVLEPGKVPVQPLAAPQALIETAARTKDSHAHEARTSAPEAPASSPLRILLAEDNLVNRSIAMQMLSHLGLTADSALNGLEVLEAISTKAYDLILMDCQMPEMDGYEATAKIRAQSTSNAKIPIVAMTANAMKGDREKCLEAGMTDYVSKPFKLEELKAAIDRNLPQKLLGVSA